MVYEQKKKKKKLQEKSCWKLNIQMQHVLFFFVIFFAMTFYFF